MTWHGQINRTLWEINQRLAKDPKNLKLRKELLRTHFLQRYEFDRGMHVPRDDRTFLFLQAEESPACLLLHGAQGTPAEMRELGNFLYTRGMSVFCPRLARFDAKQRMVSWESWVTMGASALSSTLQYTGRVILVGLSLGATISILLTRLHSVSGVVLLAPALFARLELRRRVYSAARLVTPTLFFRFAGWDGETVKAMEHIRKNPQKIEAPALILQARDDKVLSMRGLKFLRRWATHPNSEVVLLPHGSHNLTRGKAKDEVFERIHSFAQRIAGVVHYG